MLNYSKSKNFIIFTLALLFFLNILAWTVVFDLNKSEFLEVTFFDVGQGDAIFIETPKDHQILIDGGPDSTILERLAKEMSFWDRSIDLIILTHPERDHLVGLIEVLKKYKIENILWTGVVRDTFEYKEWVKLIREDYNPPTALPLWRAPKPKIKIAQAGQQITSPGLVIKILYPLENLEGQEFRNSNDTSIIAKLIFGENSFLFTGDISKSEEEKLIGAGTDINSDVLKVAHHGSKTSSSEEFLERVSPKIAVIQVGKNNRYGQPHLEVLEILNNYGINILRTDQDGDIKIISDGYALEIY